MSAVAEQLKPMLIALSAEERQEIIAFLAGLNGEGELTPDEWEEAWADEINRRVAEMRAGTAVMIPAEDVLAELKEKYG